VQYVFCAVSAQSEVYTLSSERGLLCAGRDEGRDIRFLSMGRQGDDIDVESVEGFRKIRIQI
jgi:hypothetical protein